jgi:tyrosyl-tRNA synthetase
MSFADVIGLASKYTVAQTLEREDFAQRLSTQKPIGLHEILYPLCQGQDSVAIQSDVELGGTDQRFNNLVGRELQRMSGQESQVVLLMPLLVGTDGVQKMSKSLGNYIGISDAPADMFGKVMSIPDEAMRTYFVLCTNVPLEEVDALLAGHPMDAKKRLGRDIVTQYHGADAATEAQGAFEKQFSRGEMPDEIEEVQIDGTIEYSIATLLRDCFGVSTSEARRMVGQNAVTIDGERPANANARIALSDGQVIKMGKRRYAKLKIV